MPNIMHITRSVPEETEESPVASDAESENLEDVEAADELVQGDPTLPTMYIDRSLVSESTISFYEQSGFFS